MNVYDVYQNILYNHIRELLNEDAYHKIKIELNQFLNSNNSNNSSSNDKSNNSISNDNSNNSSSNDNSNNIIEFSSNIKSAQQLLDHDTDIQVSFLQSPSLNHPIFQPISVNLSDLNQLIQNLDINNNNNDNNEIIVKLNQIYNKYQESHQSYMDSLVKVVKDSVKTPSISILELPALVFTEDLNVYRVKSIQSAYQMISYNPVEHEYIGMNDSSFSIGSVLDGNVYFKVDRGIGLLKPVNEYAIYQLYKSLYPASTSTIIAPTQLLIMNQLKTLSGDNPVKKELIRLKSKYNATSINEVLTREPEFRLKLDTSLESSNNNYIQASLYIDGISLEEYLKQCKENGDINYNQINLESYSSHILSSLLVIHTDYKADNLILQHGTNNIIGIDNDQSLESFEARGSNDGQVYPNIKNILYTLQSLMSTPIHPNVRDQFIQHNPSIFILKWLLSLEDKNSNYQSLISKLFELDFEMDQMSKEKRIDNIIYELNLPLRFTKGWITQMAQRFKTIRQRLIQSAIVTHQDLFNTIHPLTSKYYQILSIFHPSPLDQIESIYCREYSFEELLDLNQSKSSTNIQHSLGTLQISKQIEESLISFDSYSIKDSIYELIQCTDLNDLSECHFGASSIDCVVHNCQNSNKTKSTIIEWLELVFSITFYGSSYSTIVRGMVFNNFKRLFHTSWYEHNIAIFQLLLSNGSSVQKLSNVIKVLYIKINNNNFVSTINHKDIINNHNIVDQLIFIINHFGLDIKKVKYNNELLNLASSYCNFNLFIKLLDMDVGYNSNPSTISQFYQTLSNDQKLQLKSYMTRLFISNPKITWQISLNQLFPIVDSNINGNDNNAQLLLSATNSTKRIISNSIWKQLFNQLTTQPKFSLKNGKSSTILIKDEFGNAIYVKFKPQFPGTEIAVHDLCEQLFNYNLTPNCELASINNIPVLLTQEIPGEPLSDILERDQAIWNKIEPSNLSQQLIMAMLTCKLDTNLLILVYNSFNKNYLLYSVDNQLCFIDIKLNYKFNLEIDSSTKEYIRNLDVSSLFRNWLSNLNHHHQLSTNHFKSNLEQLKRDRESFIGITLGGLVTEHLVKIFQTLKNIGNDLQKERSTTIIELKEMFKFESICFSNVYDNLWHNDYSGNQAIHYNSLYLRKYMYKPIKSIKYTSLAKYNTSVLILDSLFENDFSTIKVVKIDFIEIKRFQQEVLFNCIKSNQVKVFNLKNCNDINMNTIKQFNLDYIVKLDLSGCNGIINFEDTSSTMLSFKSLVKLNLNNCNQLKSIKINSPNLNVISAQYCKSLIALDIDTSSNFGCNLNGSLSISNISILNDVLIGNSGTLEGLNISNSDLGDEVTINHNSLKHLVMDSMKSLKKIKLQLPVIESISFKDCKSLNEISTIKYDKVLNSKLWNTLESVGLNTIKGMNISINMVGAKRIQDLNKVKDFIIIVPNSAPFIIPPDTYYKYYYRIPNNFTFKSGLPKYIQSLGISGYGFPQRLHLEELPSTIKYLQLYDTTEFKTSNQELESLILGYGLNNTFYSKLLNHIKSKINYKQINK